MNHIKWYAQFSVLSVAFIYSTSFPVQASELVDQSVAIAGKTRSEYANLWWQWAVSMTPEVSPIRDQMGEFCGVNQRGDVWFLAGGYGSSKISRECTLPMSKHVFFPVINMLYYPPDTGERPSCDVVKRSAALNNDYLKTFKVTVDGKEYLNPAFFRQSSDVCFDLMGLTEGADREAVYPAATDGYWVMLKPLSVGEHTLKFNASYFNPGSSYGGMAQDIEYRLNVVTDAEFEKRLTAEASKVGGLEQAGSEKSSNRGAVHDSM